MHHDLPTRLHTYLRAAARAHYHTEDTPGFTVYVDMKDDAPGASFAMPVEPAAQGITAVEAVFTARKRVAAFTAVAGYAPDLEQALCEAGYIERERHSLMVYAGPDEPVAAPAGLAIAMLDETASVEAVRENLLLNELGFQPDVTSLPTEEDARSFLKVLTRARAFNATLLGHGVAAGLMEAPVGGVAELVGITTLRSYRRRGIATALVAHMAREARSQDVEVVFLRPNSTEAARVYARAGFRRQADAVTWARA